MNYVAIFSGFVCTFLTKILCDLIIHTCSFFAEELLEKAQTKAVVDGFVFKKACSRSRSSKGASSDSVVQDNGQNKR